jgi:hypothetical protein
MTLSHFPVMLFDSALRARTTTSAGMRSVLWQDKSHANTTSSTTSDATNAYQTGAAKQEKFQGKLWPIVSLKFGFSRTKAQGVRRYLKDNVRGIAMDNLKGQCSHGHSCKNSTQQILQAIIEERQS